ncbi:FecR family protein [Pedobacter steynii]|uniref:Ferric-dicitrate binding protein FerR, regulates iron transport through sigma-19 n=1 Tax=Pedobacter steynii TaxID=430522 RepID=A0A1D7QB94_9SPHI|nr:FecR family protein [Pedobacter steynii]AOM75966.1 hypothetical protein BFS30_01545 [Pedobacter steynii]
MYIKGIEMNIKQFGILVDRYLSGNASAIEIHAIDQWLNKSEESTEVLSDQERMKLQDELLQQIRQAMPDQAPLKQGALIRLIKPYLRIAAMLAMLIGLTWLYQSYQANKTVTISNNKVTYETYRTPKGLKAMLKLSDGSLIQLNAATVFKYPKQFQGATREVILEEGEAFFEVSPNAHKPFIVHAAHQIDTKVLGTSFNINSYRATGRLTISVNTGSVQVTKASGKSKKTMGIFIPGQGLSYHAKDEQFEYHKLDATELAVWKNNILVLKDADFNELKQRLENWYGIEVHLHTKADPTVLFTGRFFNKSLNEVLHALQRINHFHYELKSNKLTIEKERKPM